MDEQISTTVRAKQEARLFPISQKIDHSEPLYEDMDIVWQQVCAFVFGDRCFSVSFVYFCDVCGVCEGQRFLPRDRDGDCVIGHLGVGGHCGVTSDQHARIIKCEG
jgi:hypothetical protein